MGSDANRRASVEIGARLLAPVELLLKRLVEPRSQASTILAVLIAYVAIWTIYGVLAKASQGVHYDMAELAAWARELAWGYWKHPPFAAWVVYGWFALFPVADWSFYLLGMTVAALALWLSWL